MSVATKLGLTALVALVAAWLVLWSGSPLDPALRPLVVVLALSMVAVLWLFPRVSI
jgi:hypothetical protein